MLEQLETHVLALEDSALDPLGARATVTEILQQPATILSTQELVQGAASQIAPFLDGARAVILTGSGSSEFAGHCAVPALRCSLISRVEYVASGRILTEGSAALPEERPALLVSLARSGNSPESVGVVSQLLDTEPEIWHLALTCNAEGALARKVSAVTLDERTNDRSLVMTSSFTALTTAALGLGLVNVPEAYAMLARKIAACTSSILLQAALLKKADSFTRVVYLGESAYFGAARECALKMLEMTAGRIPTMAETYLGLRHGPLSFIDKNTLVVAFLSSSPLRRSYEADLLDEINRKSLGNSKVILGANIPSQLLCPQDIALNIPGLESLGDDNAAVPAVVVGQLLGLYACLRQGLRPDAPSPDGVISRVVNSFQLHRA